MLSSVHFQYEPYSFKLLHESSFQEKGLVCNYYNFGAFNCNCLKFIVRTNAREVPFAFKCVLFCHHGPPLDSIKIQRSFTIFSPLMSYNYCSTINIDNLFDIFGAFYNLSKNLVYMSHF